MNPVLPSPRTWSPGDLVTVPRLRADLSDAVALLAQRPYFVAQNTTGEAIGSGGIVTLAWDATLTDTWGGFTDPSTNVYRCQLPGWYWCDVRVPFSYTSATPAAFTAGFGGGWGAVTVNGSTGGTVITRSADLVEMPAGGPSGTVTAVIVEQNSGSTVNLNAGPPDIPTVSMRWVCAMSGTQPLPVPPLTACPSPITSAWLNANLRDAVSFLAYPPIMRAHSTSGSVATSTLSSPQGVSPGTVDVDNYGGYSSGLYRAPVAGRYFVAGQVNYASSSTTATYACGIRVNGSTVSWGSAVRFAGTSLAGGAAAARRIRLSAGDTVQLVAAQNSGASLALNTTAANETRLIVVWEGI